MTIMVLYAGLRIFLALLSFAVFAEAFATPALKPTTMPRCGSVKSSWTKLSAGQSDGDNKKTGFLSFLSEKMVRTPDFSFKEAKDAEKEDENRKVYQQKIFARFGNFSPFKKTVEEEPSSSAGKQKDVAASNEEDDAVTANDATLQPEVKMSTSRRTAAKTKVKSGKEISPQSKAKQESAAKIRENAKAMRKERKPLNNSDLERPGSQTAFRFTEEQVLARKQELQDLATFKEKEKAKKTEDAAARKKTFGKKRSPLQPQSEDGNRVGSQTLARSMQKKEYMNADGTPMTGTGLWLAKNLPAMWNAVPPDQAPIPSSWETKRKVPAGASEPVKNVQADASEQSND